MSPAGSRDLQETHGSMASTLLHWVRIRHANICSVVVVTDQIIAEADQAPWAKAATKSWVHIIYL